MNVPRLARSLVSLLLLLPVLGGCSSKDNPTAPPTGGGTLNSGTIAPGGMYEFTFATADTVPYDCTIHPTMPGGEVRVAPGGPATAAVSIVSTGAGYNPAVVNVAPGGKVTWTNNDGVGHTVTAR